MPVTFIEPLTLQAFQDEKKIYRIITFDRILNIFEQRKFTFLSPSKWNDPYEKGFLTLNITQNGHPVVIPTVPQEDPVQYKLFSQCWSGIQESEAFWRVRSPNNDGINISVQPNILYTYLDALPQQFYIGKVTYLPIKDIFDPNQIRNELANSGGNNILFHIRLLLRKRLPYRYENEYRIFLVSDRPYENEFLDILNFNPCHVFYSLMLHPKMGKNFEAFLKTYFKSKCGNLIKIRKSKFEAPIPPIDIAI